MEQILWTAARGARRVVCSIVRGCSGVQLKVTVDDAVLRQEQYPDSSIAYERARQVRAEFERDGYAPPEES